MDPHFAGVVPIGPPLFGDPSFAESAKLDAYGSTPKRAASERNGFRRNSGLLNRCGRIAFQTQIAPPITSPDLETATLPVDRSQSPGGALRGAPVVRVTVLWSQTRFSLPPHNGLIFSPQESFITSSVSPRDFRSTLAES